MAKGLPAIRLLRAHNRNLRLLHPRPLLEHGGSGVLLLGVLDNFNLTLTLSSFTDPQNDSAVLSVR